MRRWIILAALLMPFAACTCQTGAPSQPENVASLQVLDPHAVAENWAKSPDRAGVPTELKPTVQSWTSATVIRIWRDDAVYRALVAQQDSDRPATAALLTLVASGQTWRVDRVESAQTDVLWPSIGE